MNMKVNLEINEQKLNYLHDWYKSKFKKDFKCDIIVLPFNFENGIKARYDYYSQEIVIPQSIMQIASSKQLNEIIKHELIHYHMRTDLKIVHNDEDFWFRNKLIIHHVPLDVEFKNNKLRLIYLYDYNSNKKT